jgi:hypothetical protein
VNSTPDDRSPPPMPRWVKIFAIVVGILILLIAIVLIALPGQHGPGRHIHGAHPATAGLEPQL